MQSTKKDQCWYGGWQHRHQTYYRAFIVKHKLGLTDEETLLTISENPYIQFFMGLDHYQPDLLFSPTLFVEMRKKLGEQTFDGFSTTIMSIAHPDIDQNKKVGLKETKREVEGRYYCGRPVHYLPQ